MALETLRLVRDVLLRSFAAGIVVAIVVFIAFEAGRPLWSALVYRTFHAGDAQLDALVLTLFGQANFALIFGMLVPALAIQWTIRSQLSRTR